MKRWSPRLAITIISCVAASNWARAAIEYANVTGGRVQGEVKDGLASFKGLPFAAAPVGALRWRVPQPVVAWRRVRKADTFARACIQPWADNPELSLPSEDCLYLNVWTAAATAKRATPGHGLDPCMVFGESSHSQRLPNAEGLKALDALLRCDIP